MISSRARDLIIAAEVTDKKTYNAKYQRPEWPGGNSGVTVGIGYDLGMAERSKIGSDWQGRVSPAMLKAMQSCAGISGQSAKTLLPRVRNQISIDWDTAIQVFDDVDMVEWEDRVVRKIPKAADLNGDCLGVLVSLAYNRGAAFDKSGDRYREMRAIKADVQNGDLEDVPAQLRSMKRLWPDMKGLRVRREDEATLWEDGLHQVEDNAPSARENTGDNRSDDSSSVSDKITSVADTANTIVTVAKPMLKSNISWGAVGLGTTSIASAAAAAPPTLLQQFIEIWKSPIWWLIIMNIAFVGFILWHYWRDHGKGALDRSQ